MSTYNSIDVAVSYETERDLFAERKIEKFKNSGKLETIENAIDKAEETAVLLQTISHKLENIAIGLLDNSCNLRHKVNSNNFKRAEEILALLETKQDILEGKLKKDLANLSKTFKIDNNKNTIDKAEVEKNLGF